MQLENNGTAFSNIRREIDITAEELINKFAEKRRRFYLFYVSNNFSS